MNHCSDLLLVFQRPLEDIQRRAELDHRPVYALQDDASVAVEDEVVDPHRVLRLLPGLGAHPLREAWKVLRLAVCGHREILVGRKELVLDLLVHRVLYRFAKQSDLLFLDRSLLPGLHYTDPRDRESARIADESAGV